MKEPANKREEAYLLKRWEQVTEKMLKPTDNRILFAERRPTWQP
jgi:hypothetical protein